MKKILVILNGQLIPYHVVNTAIKLAKSTESYLQVVFINYAAQLAEYDYPFPNDLSLTTNRLTGESIAAENAALLKDNIRLMMDQCSTEKINFSIDPDADINLGALFEYSAFADCILADATEHATEGHIADLLKNAHCPIYLVSKTTTSIENIILTYDGSSSSMHAIKAFAYLFPELKQLPVTLVHVATDADGQLPQQKNIMSWLQAHYQDIPIKVLHGNLREKLVGFTKSVKQPLVVMGSFGRSAVSNFFHKSIGHTVIEEGHASLFVAHD